MTLRRSTHCECARATIATANTNERAQEKAFCVVCQEDIIEVEFFKMDCGHGLHFQCAASAFRVDDRCPVCRATLQNSHLEKKRMATDQYAHATIIEAEDYASRLVSDAEVYARQVRMEVKQHRADAEAYAKLVRQNADMRMDEATQKLRQALAALEKAKSFKARLSSEINEFLKSNKQMEDFLKSHKDIMDTLDVNKL